MYLRRFFICKSSKIWFINFLFSIFKKYILTFSNILISQSERKNMRIHWFWNRLTNSSFFHKFEYWSTSFENDAIVCEVKL
jgi:hypothetical protein